MPSSIHKLIISLCDATFRVIFLYCQRQRVVYIKSPFATGGPYSRVVTGTETMMSFAIASEIAYLQKRLKFVIVLVRQTQNDRLQIHSKAIHVVLSL